MKNKDNTDRVLVRVFGSISRARILSLLLNNPETSFYQREIMYETGLSLQAVQRELRNLVGLGIVKREGIRSKIYYEANKDSPFSKPLRDMLGSVAKIEERDPIARKP